MKNQLLFTKKCMYILYTTNCEANDADDDVDDDDDDNANLKVGRGLPE